MCDGARVSVREHCAIQSFHDCSYRLCFVAQKVLPTFTELFHAQDHNAAMHIDAEQGSSGSNGGRSNWLSQAIDSSSVVYGI